MGYEKCQDCGDPLGFGTMCRRCKFVEKGNDPKDYEAYLRKWIDDFNRAGRFTGWKIIPEDGKPVQS